MEILVAILIIALVAALVFALVRRRPARVGEVERPRASPLRRRGPGLARRDPMAEAVAEHARAMDPADVIVAEQRLRAEARVVAAGLHQGAAGVPPAYSQPGAPAGVPPAYSQPGAPAGVPAAYPQPGATAGASPTGPGCPIPTDPSLDDTFDPVTGERVDGFGDPANDPRYDDPRYDGRLAADWVDPSRDERPR